MRRLSLILGCGVCLGVAGSLSGCAKKAAIQEGPIFYAMLDQGGAGVDAATAASMISDYRRISGLSPLSVDVRLNAAAQELADKMAQADSVKLSLNGVPLKIRLADKNYAAVIAEENVSAGYRTLAEAFSGWRSSRGHDAVMKLQGATHLGIATAYAPQSKYKVYWALIVAGTR